MPTYEVVVSRTGYLKRVVNADSFSHACEKVLPGAIQGDADLSFVGWELQTSAIDKEMSKVNVPSVWKPIDDSDETVLDMARLGPKETP